MKITPEDMDDVRDVLQRAHRQYGILPVDEQRDIALALILVRIYDRGYQACIDDHNAAHSRAFKGYPTMHDTEPNPSECPYTFAHTKHWCGYEGCRDS